MTTALQIPAGFEALLVRSGVLKRCTRCGEAKPPRKFSCDKSKKGGRSTWCKACQSSRYRRYREANREAITEQQRAWREANRDTLNARKRAYHEANAESERARCRAYREANADSLRADVARRRAERDGYVPSWADPNAIADFYAATPDGFEVDHVVPHTGKHNGERVVCGLHTVENLQHLTRSENAKKSSKFAPTWEVLRPDLLHEGGRYG